MNLLWWVQIAADVLLLGALLLLLTRLRSGGSAGISAPSEMKDFLVEGQRLSQEFDRLLGEKRELVNTTIATLDNRIAQLRSMADEMEARVKAAGKTSRQAQSAEPNPAPPPADAGSQTNPDSDSQALDAFRKKVLKLARQGKAPAQIAEATGRPRGEVELVLGLSGRS
jgi:outer membrane murein-binding lipoprotein Lpp